MKRRILSITSILIVLPLLTIASAEEQIKDRVRVEPGVRVPLALQTPLSSKLSETGDPVRAVLYEDLLVEGYIVLNRGTEFLGRVTHVKPAGRALKQAELAISFDRVKTSYGLEQIATVITAVDDYANDKKLKSDGEGVVHGGRDGGQVLKNVGIGGALGTLGAYSVVLIGRSGGAATAGGVGIAGGMAAGVLLSKGAEIRLQPGTILRVQFERPIMLPIIHSPVDTREGNRLGDHPEVEDPPDPEPDPVLEP